MDLGRARKRGVSLTSKWSGIPLTEHREQLPTSSMLLTGGLLMPHLAQLLTALQDGRAQAMEALASNAGLTTEECVHAIESLKSIGCDLVVCDLNESGKGAVRWAEPTHLLDAKTIASYCSTNTSPKTTSVVTAIGSTNRELLNQDIAAGDLPVILASEVQTAGRGRSGKAWRSPFGCNVYISFAWHWSRSLNELSGLSLALGVAGATALREIGIADVLVKWPNDLLINNAKVAGILVETASVPAGGYKVVAGIGINVNATAHQMQGVDQSWTSLAGELGAPLDRNEVAGRVATAFLNAYSRFASGGMSAFAQSWAELDAFAGQQVKLHGHEEAVEGVARGIDASGRLQVDIGTRTIVVDAGEVSLRRAT